VAEQKNELSLTKHYSGIFFQFQSWN